MRLHIDTDLGGDPDDLCALAMVLNWPGVELVGVTTVTEQNGKRAGYVRHALRLAGRDDVPVAAGADVASGRFAALHELPPESRYWQRPIAPAPGPLDAALDLLQHSIDQSAVIVGIGPYTNLALLERRSPGILRRADIVLMGGYITEPLPDGPYYGREEDYNVQVDAAAAFAVIRSSDPLFVPLAVTTQTALRRSDLPALHAGNALAQLIAAQAEVFAIDDRYEEQYGILNMHHDPLTCAVALGWRDGVTIERVPIDTALEGGVLLQSVSGAGTPTRIVTAIDGERFNQHWLRTVAHGPASC